MVVIKLVLPCVIHYNVQVCHEKYEKFIIVDLSENFVLDKSWRIV